MIGDSAQVSFISNASVSNIFADATDENRKTFCNIMSALFDVFKGLMDPYMPLILDGTLDTLSRPATPQEELLSMLEKSLNLASDDSGM